MRALIKNRKLPEVTLNPTKPKKVNNVKGVASNHLEVVETPPKRAPLPDLKAKHLKNARERRSLKTKKDKARAIRLYHEGKSIAEIMETVGVAESTVYRYVRNEHKLRRPNHSLDASFIRMFEDGVPYKEIARAHGVTKTYVSGKMSDLRKEGKIGRRRKWTKS